MVDFITLYTSNYCSETGPKLLRTLKFKILVNLDTVGKRMFLEIL
jgi:hypothetical protein